MIHDAGEVTFSCPNCQGTKVYRFVEIFGFILIGWQK